MVISPNNANSSNSGIAYTAGGYNLNEERNIRIELSRDKNNTWKISDFQGNSYLVELKEKLSEEYIGRYITHNDKPLEYVHNFRLMNE